MRILVVGLNYRPEQIGIAVYTAGLVDALAEQGHEVRVVAGNPYYPHWRRFAGFPPFWRGEKEAGGVRVLRCPHYVPAVPSGRRRLVHHLSFALAALLPVLWWCLFWRPERVVAVAPSLLCAPVARWGARLAGATSWLHIHDFEVQAAMATGLLPRKGMFAAWAPGFEKRILKRFDVVSSVSWAMCRRLGELGVGAERIVRVPNWAPVDAVPADRPLRRFRSEWNIRTAHVALYSGNMANKQGLELLIETARTLAHRRDLTFVICGDGPSRSRLEAQAEGLANVQFHDLVPAEDIGALLSLASIHLLPQRAGAADLFLPSKLGGMLASGRPVVVAVESQTGLAEAVRGCGSVVPPEDPHAMARAITDLLDDAQLRQALGEAARRRAASDWNRATILANAGALIAAADRHRSGMEAHAARLERRR